jgi:UDP-2,3-diacylglucosamine pyrophosphatase LpxH
MRRDPLPLPDDEPAGSSPAASLHLRTVWISDLHLGTPGCQAAALLDFLRAVECETLYLVGDIVDGWQLKRQWYWPQSHNDVVQKLLRKARKGTRIILVPGNHDEFARRYLGHNFGGVDVVGEHVHELADGRSLWVTHGDHFDGVIQCAKWLAYAGDSAYEFTLRMNRHLNSLRARLGLPYWSLSRYLKFKVKRAVSYLGDFEAAVAREARARGVHGVVCGHIHHAEMRMIDGVLYCNDGDWVESLTALVEHADGRLEIVDWAERMAAAALQGTAPQALAHGANTAMPILPGPAFAGPFAAETESVPRQGATAAGLEVPRQS